jgi:hypothetical protein
MRGQVSLRVMLVRLVARLPLLPPSAQRGRGRPKVSAEPGTPRWQWTRG